jgi:hypothetical protein
MRGLVPGDRDRWRGDEGERQRRDEESGKTHGSIPPENTSQQEADA